MSASQAVGGGFYFGTGGGGLGVSSYSIFLSVWFRCWFGFQIRTLILIQTKHIVAYQPEKLVCFFI
ncbi:MAG: hypothetical protein NTZ19_04720 [Bacteroidetes bacterium]|nr:hypothetical protein [Bacteroidota bacterium]